MAAGALLASAAGSLAAAALLVSLAVWGAGLAALLAATRARRPEPLEAGLELGEEPPAVAGLLLNGWCTPPEAAPATLLDLAARRILAVERAAPEHYVVRVRRRVAEREEAGLAAYERQVLQHVRSLAHDGLVPAEALTTGPQEHAAAWRRRFDKAVVADARRRGLSRPRWSAVHRLCLGVLAAPPAVLGTAALALAPERSTSSDDSPLGLLVAPLLVWAALMAVPERFRAERDTPAGLAAAGRWLGLGRRLRDHDAFAEQGPDAVAVWDRLLAFGAAAGAAPGAVRALPLGAESPTRAWSRAGGQWRRVRIRYPRVAPPGWGANPALAVLQGGALMLVFGAVARSAAPSLLSAGPGLLGSAADLLRGASSVSGGAAVGLALLAVVGAAMFVAMGVGLLAGFAAGVVLMWFGVADLVGGRREEEGLVLRTRLRETRFGHVAYLAVDPGVGERLRAWAVRGVSTAPASPGDRVRAKRTRWLGHVADLSVTPRAAAGPSTAPAAPAPAASASPDHTGLIERGAQLARLLAPEGGGRPAALVDPAWLAARAGAALVEVTADAGELPAGWVSVFAAPGPDDDRAEGGLRLTLQYLPEGASAASAAAALPTLVARPVEGVGHGAAWLGRSRLVAWLGPAAVVVTVAAAQLPEPARQALAADLARALFGNAAGQRPAG